MRLSGGVSWVVDRMSGPSVTATAILSAAPAAAQSTVPVSVGTPSGDIVLHILLALLAVAVAVALGFGLVCRQRMRVLSELFDSLPSARLVIDGNGNPVAVTSTWKALFGEPERSLQVLAGLAARDGTDGKERFDRLLAAARNRQPAHAEFRLNLPDMEFVEISVMKAETSADSVFWRIEDVSERYELERVIRTEQEKLIEFVENAPIGFYSVDRDGRFKYVNATFANWFGKTESDLVNGEMRLRDLLPDRLGKTCSSHSPLADQDGDAVGDTQFIGRNGDAFDAYITQTVVVDDSNGDLRTRTLVRHLSGERNFAEAIRVSQERFQRFFFDAPVGIVLLDPDARVTECNQAFENTKGLGTDKSVGRAFADFIHADDRDNFDRWVSAAFDAAAPSTPIEVRLGDGDSVTVSLYAGRAESADGPGETREGQGAAGGLIVHVFDLSEQKRIEAQFFQSQKMELVGQLAGGIAHDFNNLLTAMIGFCDLLLLRHTPRDQSFADIQQIKQNANRAANLVRQLLAFSRQQTLQPKILDMTDVLSETSYLLRRLIGADIELKFYHGRDLWLMKADQGQFEQVVINLAVNARDAMNGGGTLTIRTSNVYAGDPRLRNYEGIPDGDYVLLEMQDSGTGIPGTVIGKIFEPFFTTKEVGAGTGLGL